MALPPRPIRPPRPLPRFEMKGIGFSFKPSWMQPGNEFYMTNCGVAVSLDGLKTHPATLTLQQYENVCKLREIIDYYRQK